MTNALAYEFIVDSERETVFEQEPRAGAIMSEVFPPTWWSAALQQVSSLLDLPKNWDSYGAERISRQNAYYAVQILQQISRPGIPAPSIVPTVRGNLQFEWHRAGIDLEIEILSPTRIRTSYEDELTGVEWERDLDYNLAPLTDVVRTLICRQAEGV